MRHYHEKRHRLKEETDAKRRDTHQEKRQKLREETQNKRNDTN